MAAPRTDEQPQHDHDRPESAEHRTGGHGAGTGEALVTPGIRSRPARPPQSQPGAPHVEYRVTVDVIIVGAQKCATTTLFKILSRHPGIVGSRIKEPHFFSTSPDWEQGVQAYEALFDKPPNALACEASTSYTFYPHRNLEIWEDIYAYNPEMRFIYLVRRPVDRIVSSYMHNLARGYTTAPIERFAFSHPLPLDATRYHTQIMPYIRRFGRDRVLILDFDDFMRRRQQTLQSVADFLGVDVAGFAGADEVHANPSIGGRKHHHRFDDPPFVLRGLRKLLPGVWERVSDRFSPTVHERPRLTGSFQRTILNTLELEIRAMEEVMGRDLQHWRDIKPPSAAEASPGGESG